MPLDVIDLNHSRGNQILGRRLYSWLIQVLVSLDVSVVLPSFGKVYIVQAAIRINLNKSFPWHFHIRLSQPVSSCVWMIRHKLLIGLTCVLVQGLLIIFLVSTRFIG